MTDRTVTQRPWNERPEQAEDDLHYARRRLRDLGCL